MACCRKRLYEVRIELFDDPESGGLYRAFTTQAEADAAKEALDYAMDDASSVFGCFEVTIHESGKEEP